MEVATRAFFFFLAGNLKLVTIEVPMQEWRLNRTPTMYLTDLGTETSAFKRAILAR